MILNIADYLQNLINPKYSSSAVKVALFVGTVLFLLNHGHALMDGNMNKQRWISGFLSYLVPYSVNIHGQWSNGKRVEEKLQRSKVC